MTASTAKRVLLCLCLGGLTSVAFSQTESPDRQSCEAINSEVNRVYDLTRQRAGPVEVFSYLLVPPAAVDMHDKRRKEERVAWSVLHDLLEYAQLQRCEVSIENPRQPLREQLPRLRIGAVDFECLKPNGVRVYTIVRTPAYTSRAEVYSVPPKGPSIVLDDKVLAFPEIAQMFLYERACEAHRQAWQLRPGGDAFIRYTYSPSFNCAAMDNLRSKNLLTPQNAEALMDYLVKFEFVDRRVIQESDGSDVRMENVLRKCLAVAKSAQ